MKNDAQNEKLNLYYAQDLFGTYTPHPQNPIKVNPKGARSAGGLFIENGKLIRPAQSCIPHYGSEIIFNEVITLNINEYEEKTISTFTANQIDKKYIGSHNISISENFVLLDGYYQSAARRL